MNRQLYLCSLLVCTLLCATGLPQSKPAARTALNGPTSLAVDASGRHLYVVARQAEQIHRIDLSTGTITRIAGNGKRCCYREGAPAAKTSIGFVLAIALDSGGNLYLANMDGFLRKVDAQSGTITTTAGAGGSGENQDGMAARQAHFDQVSGMVFDHAGDLLITTHHQLIQLITSTGTIKVIAGAGNQGFSGDGGPGRAATLRFPDGLAFDAAGNIFLADSDNCRIRRIEKSSGVISTVAITEPLHECEQHGSATPCTCPSHPVVDREGNIYFLEGAMDVVMRIDNQTSEVTKFAGTGEHGFSGDGGPAAASRLANPSGLAIDAEGNIYVAEYVNNRVRRIDAKTHVITTIAGNGLPHRVDILL